MAAEIIPPKRRKKTAVHHKPLLGAALGVINMHNYNIFDSEVKQSFGSALALGPSLF